MLTRREFLKRLGIAAVAVVPMAAAVPAQPEPSFEDNIIVAAQRAQEYEHLMMQEIVRDLARIEAQRDLDNELQKEIARIDGNGLFTLLKPQYCSRVGLNGEWKRALQPGNLNGRFNGLSIQLMPGDMVGVNGTWHTYDGITCHRWPNA